MLGSEHIAARAVATGIGAIGGLIAFVQQGDGGIIPEDPGQLTVVGLLVIGIVWIAYALLRLVEKLIDRRARPHEKAEDEDPILLLRAIRDSLRDPLHPDVGLAASIARNQRTVERRFDDVDRRLDGLERWQGGAD